MTQQDDGTVLVRATPEQVGRAALAAGQVLTELRPAGTAGLEDLFFRLTAQTGSGAAPTASEVAA